jgi:hypothetical protein
VRSDGAGGRESLGCCGVERAPSKPLQDRKCLGRSARVPQAADHQLRLQPTHQILVTLFQFGQSPLAYVHGLRPTVEIGVGLRQLKGDLCTLAGMTDQLQSLLKPCAG